MKTPSHPTGSGIGQSMTDGVDNKARKTINCAVLLESTKLGQ